MNKNSRTKNSLFNIGTNIGVQIVTLILSFLTRIIFINAFGKEYLGINGLFSNILSVLSLAELGVSGAIVYCMYKPIAEKDENKIAAYIGYYKKLYQTIGIVVATIGVIIVPFLKYLVNIDTDIGNITVYYLLYLLNTVSSYFLVYKTAILSADQKTYIIKICNACVSVVQFFVLSAVALILKNYYVYLSVFIAFSILQNAVASQIAERKYPFIRKEISLEKNEKKEIWTNIASMFAYQIGNVILNHTDNILISVMVSTIAVGLYSNYSMVVAAISTFVALIFNSLQASIGNLAAQKDSNERQYEVFCTIQLMSFWVTAFCCISFAVLFQDFIKILYTEEYLMDYGIVVACVFNFYVLNILYPVYCFRTTVGLFKQTRTIMLFTSICNLVLSVCLGKIWGLFGILVATGISRILTNFWFEPLKLFKIYLKKSVLTYYMKQAVYAVTTIALIVVMLALGNCMTGLNIYFRFVLKIILCILVPNGFLFIMFRNNKYFRSIFALLERTLIRR